MAVLIARYLAARGRRDEAIAVLCDRHEPWSSLETSLAELDVLDAVAELAAAEVIWYERGVQARGLARRRRFDLLRGLLQRRFEKPEHATPTILGALDGLWNAPAIADDTVLIRDWLLPATVDEPYSRSDCAQMLALLGDTAMARVIFDELQASLVPLFDGPRIAHLGLLAPLAGLLGGDPTALLDEATQIWDGIFDDDIDRYGVPRLDMIHHAAATVPHRLKLANDRSLPWRPQRPVSNTFTDIGRFGVTRTQEEEWAHAVNYSIRARDIPALFRIFEHARTTDLAHAPCVLQNIAELPRAWIDRAVAMQLAGAARALPEGSASVVGALAEAGHIELARALLPSGKDRARAAGWLGAHARDPALIAEGLGCFGPEQQLAQFVDDELRAGR